MPWLTHTMYKIFYSVTMVENWVPYSGVSFYKMVQMSTNLALVRLPKVVVWPLIKVQQSASTRIVVFFSIGTERVLVSLTGD